METISFFMEVFKELVTEFFEGAVSLIKASLIFLLVSGEFFYVHMIKPLKVKSVQRQIARKQIKDMKLALKQLNRTSRELNKDFSNLFWEERFAHFPAHLIRSLTRVLGKNIVKQEIQIVKYAPKQ